MTRTLTFGLLAWTAIACSGRTFSTNSEPGDASSAGAGGSTGGRGSGGQTTTGGAPSTGGVGAGGGPGGASETGGATGSGGVGGSGGASGGPSIDGGAVRCTGTDPTFPTFEKGCTNDASCVLVRHTTSCCGSELIMAINHAELARFQSAESVCDAQYPACGCASQGATAEDGTMVPWGSENLIVASCDNGTCRSHYSGKTFTCGTATCTDQQYCSVFSGGPAGSVPSYNCVFLGGCASCSCVSSTGCTCSEDQGFIRVSCAAP